jgi:hypothetical protein
MTKERNIRTEIRVSPEGFEVWYGDNDKLWFHKKFKTIGDATKETVSIKGHQRLLDDLIRKKIK